MLVKFTNHSKDCLRSIFDYYNSIGQKRKGRTIRANVISKALSLSNFPNIGQIEENLAHLQLNHRYLVEGHFKIIYRVIGSEVWITDIFDSRQDPEKMVGI
ncbi:MAG: type II toxin-antitoxin system RelE/ParE family toxin [Saprospiraceae bacterium]|nr:type II toxin-antitoxin system RelE/ParE family toxin [Saprospiraceae bacterium]